MQPQNLTTTENKQTILCLGTVSVLIVQSNTIMMQVYHGMVHCYELVL